MSEDGDEPLDVRRVLSILIGELLIAGVMFLSLTFAIYLRETW